MAVNLKKINYGITNKYQEIHRVSVFETKCASCRLREIVSVQMVTELVFLKRTSESLTNGKQNKRGNFLVIYVFHLLHSHVIILL